MAGLDVLIMTLSKEFEVELSDLFYETGLGLNVGIWR